MEEDNCECNEHTKALLEIQTKNMVTVNKIYIKRLEYIKKKIEKILSKEKKDRLDNAYIIEQTVHLLASSIEGWKRWCTIRTMFEVMTEKELEEVAQKMFPLAKKWIQIDIDITKQKITEGEKEIKDKKPMKEEKYVS